jgi:hypothetical protein
MSRSRILAAAAACLLGACVHLPRSAAPPETGPEAPSRPLPDMIGQTDGSAECTPRVPCPLPEILQFADEFRRLEGDAQARDVARLERERAVQADSAATLRLALALGLAVPPARDTPRALRLLDELDATADEAWLAGIVGVLRGQLEERTQNDAAVNRLESQVAAEAERRRTLEQQLERLTEIEKSLNERETPTAVPPDDLEQPANPPGR